MNVFDFAQDMEKSGQRFYGEMANRAREDGVKKVFRMLAQDEEKLLGRLRSLKDRFTEEGKKDVAVLERGINIFEKLRAKARDLNIENDVDAYHLAMDAEREVLDQYMKAADGTKNPEMRRVLLRIAALERRELEEIEKLYDFVNAPNEFLEWGEFSNLDEFHNFGRYEGVPKVSTE